MRHNISMFQFFSFIVETILRPVLKKKKTVQVPEEKHFKASQVKENSSDLVFVFISLACFNVPLTRLFFRTQATNYVLEHQEADSQGELETKLIKVSERKYQHNFSSCC